MSKTTEIYALIMYIKSTIALPSGTRINLPFKISEVSKIGAKLGKEPELIGIIFSNKKEAPAKEDINKIGFWEMLCELDHKKRLGIAKQMLERRIKTLRVWKSTCLESDENTKKKQQALSLAQKALLLKKKINEIDPDHKLGNQVFGESNHSCQTSGGKTENKYFKRLENIKEHITEKSYEEFKDKIEDFLKLSQHDSGYSKKEEWLKRVLLQFPWGVYTKDCLDVKKTREILDRDHYGMEEIKTRMAEHVAVMALNEKGGGIILLYGPPGVGKTSIGSGLAEALGRKFFKTSVGGARDESLIKGFRTTYVGSKYGKIAEGLKTAGSMNPVFMIDEVDKMSSNSQSGDPSSALLEVLDPEQNFSFSDHYFDENPIDLSKVLFILTANTLSTIPKPLLDRLEKIEQSSYTTQEKIKIGEKHLVRQAIKETGLILPDGKKMLELGDGIVKELVMKYVAESGVRELKRTISKLCRRFAMKINSMEIVEFPHIIKKEELIDYLGIPKARPFIAPKKMIPGESLGMAYSAIGGSVLSIETSVFEGTGRIKITGSIQEVMKESVDTALTTIRANIEEFKISAIDFSKIDIHIHVPAGATPKEGPSAGTAIATSVMSALRKEAIKPYISMTGELTSHGKVKAIGGLREKCIAAANAGIKTIILPRENEVNIKHEVPEEVKEKVNFIYVETLKEVIEKIFN